MDISADLTELGRTPIAVVSAGVKSILDICRTLEYLVSLRRKEFVAVCWPKCSQVTFVEIKLSCFSAFCFDLQETEGVCVASFGSEKEFPAFFSPRSGFKAPYNVETPRQAAEMIGAYSNWENIFHSFEIWSRWFSATGLIFQIHVWSLDWVVEYYLLCQFQLNSQLPERTWNLLFRQPWKKRSEWRKILWSWVGVCCHVFLWALHADTIWSRDRAGFTLTKSTCLWAAHFRTLRLDGKEVTPFVLRKVSDISGGISLKASILLNFCWTKAAWYQQAALGTHVRVIIVGDIRWGAWHRGMGGGAWTTGRHETGNDMIRRQRRPMMKIASVQATPLPATERPIWVIWLCDDIPPKEDMTKHDEYDDDNPYPTRYNMIAPPIIDDTCGNCHHNITSMITWEIGHTRIHRGPTLINALVLKEMTWLIQR